MEACLHCRGARRESGVSRLILPRLLQIVGESGSHTVGDVALEEFVAFHSGFKGMDDGAGGGVIFRNIHCETAVEAVILEVRLVLLVPFALEGTVSGVFPGPGTYIDLAIVKEDCVGAGFCEDEALAFLFQLLFALFVTGFLEPFREVAAGKFKTEIQERQVAEGKREICFF